jgi:hypothetical protein
MGTDTPAEVKLFLWSVGLGAIVLIAWIGLKLLERRQQRKPGRVMRRRKQASKPAQRPAHELTAAYQRGKLSDREIALALLDELEAAEAELSALKGAEPIAVEDDGAWLDRLVRALHLLFIGHTGGGKTTLVHWLATRRAELGTRVIVCDPDAAPGLWPGCEVYGYGNDFTAINTALGMVAQEVERRRKLRGSGQQRQFPPLHLVIDEYQDTATDCPLAKELVEDVLRRGRKLGVRLVIGVQDKLVKTMGFEGKGDLRKNFSYVVELRKDRSDQRWATLTATGDDEGVTYAVPHLPDPEKLIEQVSTLSNLLTPNQPNGAQPVTGYESGMVQYERAKIEQKITDNQHTGIIGMVGIEQQDAIPIGSNDTATGSNHTGESITGYNPSGSIEERVKALHFQEGWSPTKIATESGLVKGDKGKRLATVKAILGLDS